MANDSAHLRGGVGAIDVDRMRGAECPGEFQLVVEPVEGDDRMGPREVTCPHE